MALQPSFRLVKHFPYRGGSAKEWSNRYHFGPDIPASGSDWDNLTDAVVAGEKTLLPSYVTIVGSVCYLAGSDVPVHSKSYSVAGTLATSGSNGCPGDCVVLERYSTAARTSKNHPVYLFNYYHGARWDAAASSDDAFPGQLSAMSAYAANWVAGGWVAGKSYKRRGPNGADATGHFEEPYITHRDFPR